MSLEVVKTYADMLAVGIKSKEFDSLLDAFAEEFEIKAKLMGKSYEFSEKEKFSKFLNNMPSGLSVNINKILDNEDGTYTAKVAMGMGFMKMPGKWTLKVNDADKITFIEIK